MKKPRIDILDPEIIRQVGGLVDDAGITLVIYGDDLAPEEVSRILGRQPSSSHRRGERGLSHSCPNVQGAWFLSARCECPVEPDKDLLRLPSFIPTDGDVWRGLSATYHLQLRFGIHFTGWNKGLGLSSLTIARLATMGVSLEFDIYAYGEEEEGEAAAPEALRAQVSVSRWAVR